MDFCCLLLTCRCCKSDRFAILPLRQLYSTCSRSNRGICQPAFSCRRQKEIECLRVKIEYILEFLASYFDNARHQISTDWHDPESLIQYILDIPHKCRATVLDLLLEQNYSYLPTKRDVCRENRLLNLYIQQTFLICTSTVLDLLLGQKYSYLPTKRIVCRENHLLALAWTWLRSTRRAVRRLIGR